MQERPTWWRLRSVRIVASLAILLHMLAVLAEPLSMFSRGRQPAAPEAALLRRGMAPYVDFMYLNHGYFFFAPNPGPSHLMDIRLFDSTGAVRSLRLPDHRAQWPRLLYHRHFMLAEFLNQLYTPPANPAQINEMSVRTAWQRDRTVFEKVRSSMEKHLAARYQADRVEIRLVEHRLPSATEVFEDRLPLDDESLYILMSESMESLEGEAESNQSAEAEGLAPRALVPIAPWRPGPAGESAEAIRPQESAGKPSLEPGSPVEGETNTNRIKDR